MVKEKEIIHEWNFKKISPAHDVHKVLDPDGREVASIIPATSQQLKKNPPNKYRLKMYGYKSDEIIEKAVTGMGHALTIGKWLMWNYQNQWETDNQGKGRKK